MSDAAHTTNGKPKPPPATLEEIQEQRRVVEARLELAKLQRRQRLLESVELFGTGWGSIVNPREILPDPGFQKAWNWVDQADDRKQGRDWPIWYTEQDLGLFRQQSYNLSRTNAGAQGIVKNQTNYFIGTGFKYLASPRKQRGRKDHPEGPPGNDGDPRRDFLERLAQDSQDVIDRFTKQEARPWEHQPHAWWLREREACRRSHRDGESLIRMFDLGQGDMETRFVEPGQIKNPPEARAEDGWSYGIRSWKNPDGSLDVERPYSYWIASQDDPSRGEEVPADEIVHIKNPYEDAGVKRGLPDFCFDVYDALYRSSVLQRNMSIASQVQSANAEIQQWATATKDQVQEFSNQNADFQVTSPWNNQVQNLELSRPGQKKIVPKGLQYVDPPFSKGIPGHIEVLRSDYRAAAGAACVPDYFVTGDSAANTYAGVKESGAPFLRAAEAEQEYFKYHFLRVIWRAVYLAVKYGRLHPAALELIQIQAEPPVVIQRDPLQQTQRNEILLRNGIKSPQTWQLEENLDPEVEEANQAAWARQQQAIAPPQPPGAPTTGQKPPAEPGPTGPHPPQRLDADSLRSFAEGLKAEILGGVRSLVESAGHDVSGEKRNEGGKWTKDDGSAGAGKSDKTARQTERRQKRQEARHRNHAAGRERLMKQADEALAPATDQAHRDYAGAVAAGLVTLAGAHTRKDAARVAREQGQTVARHVKQQASERFGALAKDVIDAARKEHGREIAAAVGPVLKARARQSAQALAARAEDVFADIAAAGDRPGLLNNAREAVSVLANPQHYLQTLRDNEGFDAGVTDNGMVDELTDAITDGVNLDPEQDTDVGYDRAAKEARAIAQGVTGRVYQRLIAGGEAYKKATHALESVVTESRTYKRDRDGLFSTTDAGGARPKDRPGQDRRQDIARSAKDDNRRVIKANREQPREVAARPHIGPYPELHTHEDFARHAIDVLGFEEVEIPTDTEPVVLNTVLEPLHRLRAKGLPMPRALSFDPEHFGRGGQVMGEYDPDPEVGAGTGTLYFNPDSNVWDQEGRDWNVEMGYQSSAHPDNLTLHEWAHFAADQDERYGMLKSMVPGTLGWDDRDIERASRVSRRARLSALEFVSETYAGLKTDQSYDAEVMELYNMWAPKTLRG
jgi:hypothetical protein